jgi:hypothetical protein
MTREELKRKILNSLLSVAVLLSISVMAVVVDAAL